MLCAGLVEAVGYHEGMSVYIGFFVFVVLFFFLLVVYMIYDTFPCFKVAITQSVRRRYTE